ncbi:MAG: XdhC family protein [Hyphomicrobiales bacterium]
MKRETLEQLLNAQSARRAVALVTSLDDGSERVVALENAADDQLCDYLEQAFRFDKSGVISVEEGEFFINVYNPPLKMVLVGAVHIAQALIPMAQLAGFDVVVIDPRGAFATDARFPDVSLHAEWPDEIIPEIGLDARTAMVALTHDPKIDDPALTLALKSDVFYIGALGSKRTHTGRLERLAAHDFDESTLKRICGPIGLDIGAKGQAEIAISIMAEVVQYLRLGSPT